jgi:parvulin-like peptidyl-prolyl isomerase
MKGLLLAVAALGSLVFCLSGVAPAGGEGKIVAARVNGVEITMASVATMMNSLGTKQEREPASPESMEEIRKDALNQLILQELAYQKAKSDGMAVGRKEIDGALADMRKKPGGEEKFKEFLEKERITEEDLRKRIERSLTLKRVFTREVSNKVSVSEEEIREEYEKEKERYARPEKIAVTDVVFFLETGEAGSRKKAEEILKRIHDDKEKNPWNLVSDGTFATRDMEVNESREKELYAVAKNLKVGELSGVFAASGNLHVIRLKEYSPRKQFTFEEVKSRIEGKSRARALKKRMAEWEAELKKEAKIEIMESSEHPARKDDVR